LPSPSEQSFLADHEGKEEKGELSSSARNDMLGVVVLLLLLHVFLNGSFS